MNHDSLPPVVRKKHPLFRCLSWLVAVAPNLLILLALGALAAWGHHTGWKLPKFSELTGATNRKNDDWCAEHAVPESVCVECNPARWPRPRPPAWCPVHGVHECLWEHPELAQTSHTVPASPTSLERARQALAFTERPPNSRKCKLFLRRIQFASEEAAARAGIDVVPVWEAPICESVSANGEIAYDPTRVARLSSRVRGMVWRVDRGLGQAVKKGDVLALIEAAEVGKAKGEFLQSVAQLALRTKTLESLRQGASNGAIPDAKLREGEAGRQEAQIRLLAAEQALANLGLPIRGEDFLGLPLTEAAARVRYFGLPEAAVQTLEGKPITANLLPVVTPLDGVVVERQVVAGEVVDESKGLFVVADPRQMLLTLHVRQEDAGLVVLGQTVHFHPDADAKAGRRGEAQTTSVVAWISTGVDRRTRTVQVRAALDNPDGRLRDGAFGSGKIVLRQANQALVVPSEAVQWEGDCHVVFVRDKDYLKEGAPKVFHTRTVRPGAREGGNTEIIAGVLPGELVAVRGSAVLRSELLKNSLGEG